jgi:Asp-tRNA(Asn)/Glu-tRNA(Gln) amidotransferase C subunit|tara:strand:+ start:73 stop:753 length:681 start_codon:yes stop_codon:yes gene_type:complete
MKHNVYVISAGRYDKLPFNKQQKEKYIFCVKDGEKELYESHGCKNVYNTGNLMDSRNFALEHAFKEKKICVQLSDDITKVVLNKNFYEPKKIEVDEAIEDIVKKFNKIENVDLLGVPPTDNYFFAGKLVAENKFCIGDMLFVKPSEVRFDTQLTLKEDYDFTLQHISRKKVLRYQKYLFSFKHYSNKGGAVDIRNNEEEQKNIRILKSKWGDKVRLNPKRKNEILI